MDREPLRVLDLFSGIGGFSLGLERTGGFETVAFCEIEKYPQKVLAKHWPGVPIYEDVRQITADPYCGRLQGERESTKSELQHPYRHSGAGAWVTDGTTRVGPIDVITAGFPCQDISYAGKGAGIEGERSGLWSEIARLTGELRPEYLILENVSALLNRGMDRVLGDLAEIGYDAEWHCIPVSAIGAPHRRDRIWIVAYPQQGGCRPSRVGGGMGRIQDNGSNDTGQIEEPSGEVAYAESKGLQGRQNGRNRKQIIAGLGKSGGPIEDFWRIEPDVGRVAHGVPKRVDRLKGLGNAVVPQIPELIGRAILSL